MVSGCYFIVSLIVLKFLVVNGFFDVNVCLVINVVFGVFGVGRKVSLIISFFEVSLYVYGVLGYCYIFEIEVYFGIFVIFMLYLGNFKWGIFVIIIVKFVFNVL